MREVCDVMYLRVTKGTLFATCCELSLGSRVRPNILGCVCIHTIVLLICRLSLVLYSAGSRVKNVQVVLSESSMRLFDLVQVWMLCRYGCMCAFAVCVLQ